MSNNNGKKKKGMNPRTKAFITGATFVFAILVIILCIMSGALTFKTDAAKETPTPPPAVTAPVAAPTPTVTAAPPTQNAEPAEPSKHVTYSVTVFAGHGGSADPQGTMTVNAGDDITVNFIPDTGFAVSTVTVNGELVDAAESYTVTDVSEDMTIDVSFDTAAAETTPPDVAQ